MMMVFICTFFSHPLVLHSKQLISSGIISLPCNQWYTQIKVLLVFSVVSIRKAISVIEDIKLVMCLTQAACDTSIVPNCPNAFFLIFG